MFIAELSKEKQEAFLNLAYTMAYADRQLTEEEKRIFQSYQTEVSVDLDKAHKVDFEKELTIFDDCNMKQKKGVFFELYAMALIDDVQDKKEEELVSIAKNHFDISDDVMKEMREGLQALMEAYKHLSEIVNH